MPLVKWDPNREFEQALERFNRIFNDSRFFGRANDKETMTFADWSPAVDIQETPEAYLVDAELPDIKKDDVKITLHNRVLTLTGERRQEKEEKGKKFHRVERSYGRFERSFTLPDGVDEQKIHATFKDGMLRVMLPKAQASKPATHEIKIG